MYLFYEKLYKSEHTDEGQKAKFIDNIKVKLNENEKAECEGLITKDEILSALKSFENEKSPELTSETKPVSACKHTHA